jgi:hypothetical protein
MIDKCFIADRAVQQGSTKAGREEALIDIFRLKDEYKHKTERLLSENPKNMDGK